MSHYSLLSVLASTRGKGFRNESSELLGKQGEELAKLCLTPHDPGILHPSNKANVAP